MKSGGKQSDGHPFVPLGEIADVKLGKMLDRSKHKSGRNLPYLRNINVRWGHVDTSDVSEMFFKNEEEEERYSVRKGDVLVCEGGEPGRAAVWTREESDLKFQKALHRVRFRDPFEPKLLVYFLEWAACRGELEKRFTGSTIKHFTRQAFVQLPVPNPPLPEQRRIVARIEELFSRLDTGVAALRHAKAQLQRYRHSVLAAAVTGQLTQAWREQHPESQTTLESHLALIADKRSLDFEKRLEAWGKKVDSGIKQPKPKPPLPIENQQGGDMPEGWVRLKIASVCDIEDGDRGKAYPKKADFSPSGFCLFLNTGNVRPDGFRFDENQFITQAKHLDLRKGTLERGDVVFTSRGTIGNIAHYDDSIPHEVIRINSGMFILRGFKAAMTPEFLACLLRSPQIRDQIAKLQSGSAQPQLPIREFREFLGEIPPLAEQHQIVAEVEARTTAIDHLEAELDRQITRSNRLRQSTLASAFAGNLS